MAMAFSGMDLEAAQRLATATDTYVEQVEQLKQKITTRINDLDWWGPDAQKFKSEQLNEILVAVKTMTTSAQTLASTCRENLADQRRASNG
jgi:uncharacterized protein YoxC